MADTKKVIIERHGPNVPISNSDKARENASIRTSEKKEPPFDESERRPAARPRPKAAVSSPSEIKKDSFWDKFKKAWFGENVENAGEFVIFEVGIPAMKATLSDMISNGMEVLLFGESSGRHSRGRSKESSGYTGMYRRERERERDVREERRSYGYIWEQVEPRSQRDCMAIIAEMRDFAYDNEYVTVAELLDIMKASNLAEYTDENKGWYAEDLKGNACSCYAVRGGYLLDLPRPRAIRR